MNCLLCATPHSHEFFVENKPARHYFHCRRCDLIFMSPKEYLSTELEKARYDLHQNEDTSGYRRFLTPLLENLQLQIQSRRPRSSEHLKILDFGCGPTPFLCKLLREFFPDGQAEVHAYDPFYFPEPSVLLASYDIITSTEVWEHFHQPLKEITHLVRLLKAQGFLAIMTTGHPGVNDFHTWHYRRDTTHVVFFSEQTMQWLSAHFQLKLITNQSPYWIFQKGSDSCL